MAEIDDKRRKQLYYRRRKRKQKRTQQIILRTCIIAGICIAIVFTAVNLPRLFFSKKDGVQPVIWEAKTPTTQLVLNPPEYDVQLLTPNAYSRPQKSLEQVKGIVIHYTANAGTTAQQNRDYFEGLKDAQKTKVSSHFVVGISGEVVQCIPSKEIAYASNDRNFDTLSIECCHPDEDGKFTEATYQSLVHLTAWLLVEFELTTDDVIRHYDVTGKPCPLYYVENENEWNDFKNDINEYIKKNSLEKEIELSKE